jgi:hypothetical protein
MRNFKKRSLIFPIFGSLAFFVLGLNLGMIVGKDMVKDEINQQEQNLEPKTPIIEDIVNYNSIIEKLSILESGNNPDAIGDHGKAFGILQFHDIAVHEHNNQFNTNYTHQDCFNPEISKLITENLLRLGAELHYHKCRVPANESDLVRMHNGWIYRGANKESTLIYLEK